MPKRTSSKMPKGAITVRSYEAFHHHIDAFRHGERNLLVVVGPPGTAKSTAARDRLDNARIIQGGSTPYRFYQELYENRDQPIVLDDADKVFRDKQGVFLLKLVTQSERQKKVQWNSNTPEIRAGDLPAEFTTSSRLMILANSWPQDNPDIEAIESRGHLIYFVPSIPEIHAYAATFFHDDVVYQFIGERLWLFDDLDLRLYFKAAEIQATGERTGRRNEWQEYIESQMLQGEKRAAMELLRDRCYQSDNQRAKEFRRITGLSERAFYRYTKELRLRQPDLGTTGNGCQGVEHRAD